MIAIATIVAVVVGVLQWLTLGGQLDEMRAERRPWLFVSDDGGINPAGPFTFDAQSGGHLSLLFTIQNSGHSPARNVSIDGKIVIAGQSGVLNMDAEQADACKRMMKRVDGYTIFPGEKPDKGITLSISQTEIAADENRGGHHVDFIAPLLMGCINYEFPDDNVNHSTPFLRLIRAVGDDGGLKAIPTDAGPIRVKLLTSPIWNGRAN